MRQAAAGTGRGHRHRLLHLDEGAAGQVRRSETGHQGGRRRNGRRHVLHHRRRHRARPCPSIPETEHRCRPSDATRAAAARAVDGLRPSGGTAIGTWLAYVRGVVGQHPGALTHAILLTDGKDEHETPEELGEEIGLSEGEFTCDCRGVGTDWQVEELRAISSALLGTVDIVADPADLAADFAAMMRASMGKTIPELTLRLWTPVGARVVFVKQVAPTVEDLTAPPGRRRKSVRRIPAGLLGCARSATTTSRSRSSRPPAGREKLAARVSVVAGDADPRRGSGEGGVDRRHGAVGADQSPGRALHGPGGTRAGRPGRAGRTQERRRRRPRPQNCSRAMELAVESGNDGTAKLLRRVIEVDEHTGTARLRRDVAAADEMALDARSTRTARVRKEA